ncbi:MAG: hypothetical protein ACFB0B_14540 [Thermonemataceae bacterium]
MKKIYLLLLGLAVIFSSCDDDDDDATTTDPGLNGETQFVTRTVERNDVTFEETTITDFGQGTGDFTMRTGEVYILDGFVFVNEGQILTIEAGAIIKGASGQGENASALIVARGARIEAEGTAENPIIFTAEADDIVPGQSRGDLVTTASGLWGGVIILGNASLNSVPNEQSIEGVPTNLNRGIYGGDDDTDDSGIFRYVSIRHAGTDLGSGDEINGLSMGGVGSGTTIEYVEVISNKDDGFEWFGGTVNCKYLVAAFCGDDSFDYDLGWRGNVQFAFAIQGSAGERGGEHDGGEDPETGEPFATPVFFNATYIGQGQGTSTRAVTFRDNAGGEYHNSIFAEFGAGIDVEDLDDGEDSFARLVAGQLALANNAFFNVGATGVTTTVNNVTNRTDSAEDEFSLTSGGTPGVNDFDFDTEVYDPGLDMFGVPSNTGSTDFSSSEDPFFDTANYRGAFDPDDDTPWHAGWTLFAVAVGAGETF